MSTGRNYAQAVSWLIGGRLDCDRRLHRSNVRHGHEHLLPVPAASPHLPVHDAGFWGYINLMGVDPALVRMLRAGRDEGRDLEEALDGLARVFGRRATAERVGPHFTCAEANRIALALVASRHTDAAILWLDEHAASDTEEDVHGGADFDAAEYITGGR